MFLGTIHTANRRLRLNSVDIRIRKQQYGNRLKAMNITHPWKTTFRMHKTCVYILPFLLFFGCGGEDPRLKHYQMHADFQLTDHEGRPFRFSEGSDKVSLLFFGYTRCPNTCPVTLSKIRRAYKIIGNDSRKLRTLFISVDSEYDRPERLKKYVDRFKSGFIGLHGSKEELKKTAKQLQAAYGKISDDGTLQYHPEFVYLTDRTGEVRYLFRNNDTPEFIAELAASLL